MSKIHAKLAAIQAELKAPKSQFNKFGGYHYRKAEDILEAVKPLLQKHGCTLICTDHLMQVGVRYYIKAEATLTCIEDGSSINTEAYAREEEEKKGMDGSQVTGASSSYARKYALNGLFCIDDTADSDTTNVGDQAQPKPAPKKPIQRTERKPKSEEQPAEKPAPAVSAADVYAKWVKAIAEGIRTKSGQEPMEAYKEKYHPNDDQLDRLEYDVFQYRIANNIPANQ